MPRPKGIKSKTKHIWTNEQIEYLKSISKGRMLKDITIMICNEFNINLSERQVRGAMSRNKCGNGINLRFEKGNIPYNHKPLYSECIWKNGYIAIKVSDNKWITKHRYIYEQHYGKVPNGYVVVFADKNKRNFNIDNLILAKKSELLLAIKYELIYEEAELTKTGFNVAKLLDKIKEVR